MNAKEKQAVIDLLETLTWMDAQHTLDKDVHNAHENATKSEGHYGLWLASIRIAEQHRLAVSLLRWMVSDKYPTEELPIIADVSKFIDQD